MPPAASSAARRASMQPPAAAATLLLGSLTAPKGNSMSKKKTKAGIRKCSAAAAAGQPRHQRHQHLVAVLGARHQLAQIVGRMGDIGIGEPEKFRRRTRRRDRAPWFIAHSLPVQPGGRGAAGQHRQTVRSSAPAPDRRCRRRTGRPPARRGNRRDNPGPAGWRCCAGSHRLRCGPAPPPPPRASAAGLGHRQRCRARAAARSRRRASSR